MLMCGIVQGMLMNFSEEPSHHANQICFQHFLAKQSPSKTKHPTAVQCVPLSCTGSRCTQKTLPHTLNTFGRNANKCIHHDVALGSATGVSFRT